MNQDAWIEATDQAMNKLIDATQSEEGRDAFRFSVPVGSYNTWALTISGGNDDQEAFCSGVSEMRFTGQIQGRFDDLEQAQRMGILWASALPVRNDGRLVMLRMTAPPSIAVEFVTIAGTEGQAALYAVTLPLDCIVDVS